MSQIPVDLVIIIDTSITLKNEAQDLSAAAEAGIQAAASNCPSDLRIVWLGIEGTWKNTNFDQTVRQYLMENCAVAESDIRGRKKGTLKSAGAQEDAARAVQDVATHFHWQSGAKRAIFYLGDEALDCGGAKTQQKDIEAANLAIQTAKANQVLVHTYFGKSKSRYKKTLEAEYARLATETGGQAFTAQDTLEGFSMVLEQVICNSQDNPNVESESTQGQKSNILTTGLEDYSRWKSMFKDHKRDKNEKPFRRGRIWC